MSNRVRVTIYGEHGFFYGPMAYKTIEERWAAASERGRMFTRMTPEGFKDWPRWKRFKHMAKQLGDKPKIFREPRNVPMKRSLYGLEIARQLGAYPVKNSRKKVVTGTSRLVLPARLQTRIVAPVVSRRSQPATVTTSNTRPTSRAQGALVSDEAERAMLNSLTGRFTRPDTPPPPTDWNRLVETAERELSPEGHTTWDEVNTVRNDF
jgi:hypothetical protein